MNKPTADEYPSLQPNTNCATLFRNVRNAILNHARSHHASNYNNSPNDSALHHSPPSKPPPSPFRTTRHTVTVENVQPLIPPKKEPEEVKLAAPQETVAPRPTGAKKPQRPHSALPGGISPTRVQHLGDVVAGPAGRSLRHGGLKNNYTRETNPRANRYISTYPKREVSPKKPANRGNEEYHQHSSTAYAVRQRKNYMQQSTPYDTVNQGNASTNRSSKVRKLFSRRGFYAPMPWDSTTKVDYVENVKGGFRPSRQNSPSGNTSNNNVSRLDGQRTSPSRKTSPNKPSTAYSSVKKPARRPQSATLHRTKEFYLQDTQTPDEYVVYSAGGQSSIKQTPTSQGEENIFVVNNKYTKYILECQNHKILVENELRQLYIAKSALEEKLKEVNRQQKQQNRMGNAAYVNQHHTVTEYSVQDILNTLNELKQNVIHHLRLLSAIQKREKELKLLEKEYFHKKSRAANGQPAEDPNIPSMEEIMTLLAESNTKIKENNGSHGVNDSSEVQRTLFRGATPISQIQ
ncbi:hypothetical protein AGDE_14234 [Angomonas deanei]|nr:hypothetical protein AGDE_14234 [Angomonas deanei]|eukprot:EPY21142.1 hypothetical protein AGDE_14234 [Angomonas deanei]